jgi:hypothetical protein
MTIHGTILYWRDAETVVCKYAAVLLERKYRATAFECWKGSMSIIIIISSVDMRANLSYA